MGHQPIPLNDEGRRQLERLRNHLAGVRLDAIYTSPMRRAVESAQILQRDKGIPLHETFDLAEINYGDWVGMTFDEVRSLPQFKDYHLRPSRAEIPQGESFHNVVERVDHFFANLRAENRPLTVLAVSHADVIKAAIIRHLKLPLDEIHRIRIDNGSYSVVWIEDEIERVLVINSLPQLGDFFEKQSLFRKEEKKIRE